MKYSEAWASLAGGVLAALLTSAGCGDTPDSRSNTSPGAPTTAPSGLRKLTPEDLRVDSSNATAVISSAQKFIIPVAALGNGGELLRYPVGHEKAGQPIVDFEGKPIGERGLIFFNDKDQTTQAVAGDGQGVIIINEVTAEQADKLERKISEFGENPHQLTLNQLKQTLEFARTELKLGDMYNSTRSFVRTRMTPVIADERARGNAMADYGLKKRDDRDICYAVYVPGAFVFEGPAASPQVFENGGVIVRQGTDVRGVQPEVFVRTYRLADGRTIASLSDELKVWRP